MKTVRKHITTSVVTPAIDGSCFIKAIYVGVKAAGTTWLLGIKDRASSPYYLSWVPVTAQTDVAPRQAVFSDVPAYMEGGVDIETSGTAGSIDVQILYEPITSP